MTSTDKREHLVPKHPDFERLSAVIVERREQHVSLLHSLEGWVDPGTLLAFSESYAPWIQAQALPGDNPTEMLACAYTDGFLLGVRFQAAGGHREVDA